ncbi:MAG TPA: hypothetical protein VFM15_07160 [Gammaproteobacteria bacterium]|nr:hypothetical protein [Gammaproteobacteria bacterium]
MRASAVRDLARRHAAGELSHEDYRAQRHLLIEEIIAGTKNLAYDEQRIPRPRRPLPLKWFALAGVAIAAIIAITVIVWLTGRSHTAAPKAEAGANPAEATQTSPGPQLVADFLHTNSWDQSHVQLFMQQWNALPGAEKQLARQDFRFPRLNSALRQQIVSQQAMADLTKNNPATQAQLASLKEMAKVLGIKQDE